MVRNDRKYDLEDRLIDFSISLTDIAEALPNTRAGNYLASQLTRCGLAPSLMYGEAQSAESREDFIHKIKLSLKELKETRVCLKLIGKKKLLTDIHPVLLENEQLIAILGKSIATAKQNVKNEQR